LRADEFVDGLDDQRIVQAIRDVEARTRAEVRVHVEDDPVADVQAAAQQTFETLGMTATAERNGVLVFVAPESQAFAVLGDAGIHERCGQAFWDDVAAAMREEFRAGRFTDGIVAGVRAAGDELARHFPRREGDGDQNELPDAISRS
jgi:uncharacterized membrane protein